MRPPERPVRAINQDFPDRRERFKEGEMTGIRACDTEVATAKEKSPLAENVDVRVSYSAVRSLEGRNLAEKLTFEEKIAHRNQLFDDYEFSGSRSQYGVIDEE